MIVLHLSTYQAVLLAIVAFAISLFFVLGAVLLAAMLGLVKKVKKVVVKAESAIESAEEAAQTIRNIGAQADGPMAALKIIKSIRDTFSKK